MQYAKRFSRINRYAVNRVCLNAGVFLRLVGNTSAVAEALRQCARCLRDAVRQAPASSSGRAVCSRIERVGNTFTPIVLFPECGQRYKYAASRWRFLQQCRHEK